MKYTYYGETKCSFCGCVSRNQPKGDGCHSCLREWSVNLLLKAVRNASNPLGREAAEAIVDSVLEGKS